MICTSVLALNKAKNLQEITPHASQHTQQITLTPFRRVLAGCPKALSLLEQMESKFLTPIFGQHFCRWQRVFVGKEDSTSFGG